MLDSRAAATIGIAFGLVFVVVNAGAADPPWSWVLRAAGVVAAIGVGAWVWSAPPQRTEARPGALRVYWVCVAAEVVALFAGLRVLDAAGRSDFALALIAAIVGLHFLPFSRAFGQPQFLALGLVLLVVAALGAFAHAPWGVDGVTLVAGVGSGAVLLAFAAATPRGAREVDA